MRQNENKPNDLLDKVKSLLSSYIDGEVTSEERQFVERMLILHPELHLELQGLKKTIALVESLPRRAAPRPFFITEADVGIKQRQRWKLFDWEWLKLKPAFKIMALVTTILIAVFLVTDNFIPISPESNPVAVLERAEAPAASDEIIDEVKNTSVKKESEVITTEIPSQEPESSPPTDTHMDDTSEAGISSIKQTVEAEIPENNMETSDSDYLTEISETPSVESLPTEDVESTTESQEPDITRIYTETVTPEVPTIFRENPRKDLILLITGMLIGSILTYIFLVLPSSRNRR